MSKKIVIEEIQDFVLKRMKELEKDSKDIKDKLGAEEIYWNVYKFLKDYEENRKVLNQYHLSKKFKNQTKGNDRDFGDDDRYNY